MRVLLIGSGGREHSLAWALSRSPFLTELFAAPGNAGLCELARCVQLDITDHAAVLAFCRAAAIDLVVIGPELPLVAGLVDDLEEAGLRAFGPNRAAAQLEGSKRFTKDLCKEAGIPTASYASFNEQAAALDYVAAHGAPVVIKADGLAAGKGVTVASDVETARAAVAEIFSGGHAGSAVVIEEFLEGEEASFFAISDGRTVIPFGTAQDHKRAYDGDTGPNTGGMGAYSPAPVLDAEMCDRVMAEIIEPTISALARRGIIYKGVLYAGLMITPDGPKLIEYNARFGDPECQVLMMRLEDDLLPILDAAVEGQLDGVNPRWRPDAALAVVLAARGYPGPSRNGTRIGIEEASNIPGVEIFHAGTKRQDGALLANGGRVLNVAARGPDVSAARDLAYRSASLVHWPEGFYRRDIGWRAVHREANLRRA